MTSSRFTGGLLLLLISGGISQQGSSVSDDSEKLTLKRLRTWSKEKAASQGLLTTFLPKTVASYAAKVVADHFPSPQRPDVYQFGVYTGGSLKTIKKTWAEHNLAVNNVWAFDSFVGLAEPTGGDHKDWSTGAFSAADAFSTSTYSQVLQKIRGHVADTDAGPRSDAFIQKLHFIRGYFNESLTPGLPRKKGMRPAAYVDIDVDQYAPSIQALSWLFRHGLVVPGSIVGFDDFGSTELWTAGESKALYEVASKYKAVFKLVFSPCLANSPARKMPRVPPAKARRCSGGFVAIFRLESVGTDAGIF